MVNFPVPPPSAVDRYVASSPAIKQAVIKESGRLQALRPAVLGEEANDFYFRAAYNVSCQRNGCDPQLLEDYLVHPPSWYNTVLDFSRRIPAYHIPETFDNKGKPNRKAFPYADSTDPATSLVIADRLLQTLTPQELNDQLKNKGLAILVSVYPNTRLGGLAYQDEGIFLLDDKNIWEGTRDSQDGYDPIGHEMTHLIQSHHAGDPRYVPLGLPKGMPEAKQVELRARYAKVRDSLFEKHQAAVATHPDLHWWENLGRIPGPKSPWWNNPKFQVFKGLRNYAFQMANLTEFQTTTDELYRENRAALLAISPELTAIYDEMKAFRDQERASYKLREDQARANLKDPPHYPPLTAIMGPHPYVKNAKAKQP